MPKTLKYSVFQNWVLFVLFENYNKALSSKDLLLRCCDTALGDLTEEKVKKDLSSLQLEKLIEDVDVTDTAPSYLLTASGILYVRQNLIKPILDLVQRNDFRRILTTVTNSALLVNTVETMHNTSMINPDEIDKPKFTSQIVNYAINHVAPVVEMINNILRIYGGQ